MDPGRTHQIKSTSNKVISHTRTILGPSTAHKNHAVLLYIVSFAGDVRGHDLSVGQAHLGRLALAGVGLLGFRNAHFETHAFHLGTILGSEGRGDGVAGFLWPAALCAHLVECHGACGGAGEWVGA